MNVGTDRDQGMMVIKAVYQDRLPTEALEEFDIQPLIHNDETVGMLMIRGPEVHVAILPAYRKRWITRGLINAVLGGLESKHGYALTSCFDGEPEKKDFITRLGFQQIHAENGMLFFERAS